MKTPLPSPSVSKNSPALSTPDETLYRRIVQQYLPYTKGLYRGDHPSASSQNSANYRERIRLIQEKVLKKNRELISAEGWTESDAGNLIPAENEPAGTRSSDSSIPVLCACANSRMVLSTGKKQNAREKTLSACTSSCAESTTIPLILMMTDM